MADVIEPPDPLTPQVLLDFVSQPGIRWVDNHCVDTSESDAPSHFAVLDGVWVRKGAPSADTYAISEVDFGTLVGARDPQPDGQYTTAGEAQYSLHPTVRDGVRWAVATPVPSSA